jgi:hypothetical protein
MKAYRGNRLVTPLILILGDGDEWSTSRPGRFDPGKGPRYLWNRRLDGSQSRNGRFAEKEDFFTMPGFEF